MTNNSREIDKELASLIYKQTNNENFTRNICMFMDTDEQKRELINFIKENNPTLTEINHRSFDIVMFESKQYNRKVLGRLPKEVSLFFCPKIEGGNSKWGLVIDFITHGMRF